MGEPWGSQQRDFPANIYSFLICNSRHIYSYFRWNSKGIGHLHALEDANYQGKIAISVRHSDNN